MSSRLHNEVRARIIAATKLIPTTVEDLFKELEPLTEGRGLDVFEAHYITPLVIGGFLEKDAFNLISYKMPKKLVAAPANLFKVSEGSYDGRELTRTCQRPGAYDFLSKPSDINGDLIPYKWNKE